MKKKTTKTKPKTYMLWIMQNMTTSATLV